MQFSRILFRVALLLLPVTFIGTTWLYLYPVFHKCAFPTPPVSSTQSVAPFRLLALGDPQLEGDSSLPDPNARIFPSVEHLVPHIRDAASMGERRDIVLRAGKGLAKDARRWVEGKRKAVDLWGNDWYLAHIVRTLRWWTEPTHISVLGDLLGSQWITDGEFRKRARRYWNIVMRDLELVPAHVFGVVQKEAVDQHEIPGSKKTRSSEEAENMESVNNVAEKEPMPTSAGGEVTLESQSDKHLVESKPERNKMWGGTNEILGADKSWAKRVINIAGNHDVGYAGDIDESRIERFERAFGSVNWDIWFTLPPTSASEETDRVPTNSQDPSPAGTHPALRLVVLNSMNLDTPAWAPDLQTETYNFVNHIITTSRPVVDKTHATILLTHIPLEKQAGVCVDSPYFDYFESGQGVKEQNMLSDHASKIVLEGIFGMSGDKNAAGGGQGRRGIVLNGHDHAGCDVMHYIRQNGVDYQCRHDEIRKNQAYWPPVASLDDSTSAFSVDENFVIAHASSFNVSDPSIADMAEAPGKELAEASQTIEDSPEGLNPQVPGVKTFPRWQARRFPPLPYDVDEESRCMLISQAPHVREITLRSMMGEYSGYAGFLSAWFDDSLGEKGEWVFEFATCGVGVQHWWWGVHIVLSMQIAILLVGCACSVCKSMSRRDRTTLDTRKIEDIPDSVHPVQNTSSVISKEKCTED
ncbi:hypothetical protein ACN47E_007943 [Coniothyrium glycines]